MDQMELEALAANISQFSPEEQAQIVTIIEELERRNNAKLCQTSLIEFCKHMDPTYIVAPHHKKLAVLLTQVAFGTEDRIAVSIPPRHGKSHLISTLFPAWFLGRFPDKKVLMVSHTGDLAVDFGRKVRNIIADPRYASIFPGVTLAADSKSAGRWSTSYGGEFYACGVGAALAGRGADLLLVDDPHSEQDLLSGNFDELEKAYQWFAFGARTRLMSGGRIAVVHCMTGDTPVLMGDGNEKPLRDVRPGDVVASHNGSQLVPAKVLNWTSQGIDRIFTIKTTSGRILRANWKHPLLAQTEGKLEWTKVKNLKVGSRLIGVSKTPQTPLNYLQNGSVFSLLVQKLLGGLSAVQKNALNRRTHSESANTTITKIAEKLRWFLDRITGANGVALHAVQKAVLNQPIQRACANLTTINTCGRWGTANAAQKKTAMPTSSTGMVSVLRSTINFLRSKTVNALSVYVPQDQTTSRRIGMENWGSTIATARDQFGHFSATTVTSSSVKTTPKRHYFAPLSTYELTSDVIVEITSDAYEEVFDIQVEGTENFIANGVISHNTRWHESDLIGHLIKDGANNPKADQYKIFEFPAIITTKTTTSEGEERVVEKALWPEKFDLEALARTKASMPAFQWNAQYMQNPTGEQGAIIQRDWWRSWKKEDPPKCEYVIMALDAAAEKTNRADYTAILTFGVFSDDELTDGNPHIILLNAINVRVEFPELKDLAIQEWKEWEPDAFIVEKKSSGIPLYQELRRMGIPVQEFTPNRGTGDKIARLNAVADIIRSGMVWYPEGRRWAEEVIEQSVAFPYGTHDDLVDCLSMALSRYRQGGFITLPSDYRDPEYLNRPRRAAYY